MNTVRQQQDYTAYFLCDICSKVEQMSGQHQLQLLYDIAHDPDWDVIDMEVDDDVHEITVTGVCASCKDFGK